MRFAAAGEIPAIVLYNSPKGNPNPNGNQKVIFESPGTGNVRTRKGKPPQGRIHHKLQPLNIPQDEYPTQEPWASPPNFKIAKAPADSWSTQPNLEAPREEAQ